MNALWAVGYPVTAIALRAGASPGLVAAVRLTVAFLVFVPLLWRVRHWSWKLLGAGAVMGLVGFSLPLWLQIVGLYRTDPAIAAISISSEPLFTILLAAILTRTRTSGRQKVALIIALTGSWILTGEPRPGHAPHLYGDVALFLAVGCFAVYNVYSPKLSRWVDAGPASALVFGFGALGSTAAWLLGGASLPTRVTPSLVWSLAFLALGATAAAYFLWLYAVGKRSIAVAALFLYTQPLLGSLLSWVLGQSRITWPLALGGCLILLAVALGDLGSQHAPGT